MRTRLIAMEMREDASLVNHAKGGKKSARFREHATSILVAFDLTALWTPCGLAKWCTSIGSNLFSGDNIFWTGNCAGNWNIEILKNLFNISLII